MNNKFWGDESEAVRHALDWAKKRTVTGSDPKTTALDAKELDEKIGQTISDEGMGAKRAMDIYTELSKATRSADDPMNFAYIPGAPTRSAVAFDEVVSAANVFGGLWESGSGALYAENQVIDWLKENLSWPSSAAGTFVSGGTLGNLAALSCARDKAKRVWNEEGRYPKGEPVDGFKLVISQTTHSSVKIIAKVMDVEVITVPVDENYRMSGKNLKKVLDENEGVFAVVATTGTTNSGIIDDLESIVKVAHEKNIWVHVDGAYGGAGIIAPSVRPLYKGIEEVDSFIVDPHKWLFAPYDCCAVIYRDPSPAFKTFSQHAEYLDNIDHSQFNPSDLAIHLSRRTRGLPLWYSLAVHGKEKYSQAVETCIANAKKCAEAIKESDHLELVMEPTLSIVVFKRKGWDDKDYKAWSDKLALAGEMLCIPTSIAGETVLRLAFLNPNTDIDKMIDMLLSTSK